MILLLAAAGGAGFGWLPAAVAHPGQTVDLRISINDEQIGYKILMSADFLSTLFPSASFDVKLSQRTGKFQFVDSAEEQRARAAFEEFFKDKNPVTVDGVLVRPLLTGLEFIPAVTPGIPVPPDVYPPDVRIMQAYPTKGRARHISMVWDLYPQDPNRVAAGLGVTSEVIAELNAYDENKIIMFTAQEPEIIWHACDQPARKKVSPVVAMVEPETIPIPLLSLGIIGVWAIGLLVLRLTRVWHTTRRPAFVSSVVALGVALYCHDFIVTPIAAPWKPAVKLPGEQEATDIFSSLHRNVYRAFDYKTESDTYDVLAQSVDGDLLDQVYNEVHQSLILRDQGGAVARVQSVDIMEAKVESAGVLSESQAAAFRVRSRWQVHGAVYHWGHVHSRTNEYTARYTVAQRGANWKITGVEVLEQHRIVFADDDPPISLPAMPGEPRP